jgi:hypothetical protein
MNDPFTEIAFIFDRTSPMESIVEPAISSFNRLLRKQQQQPGSARFTLVHSDDPYEVPKDSSCTKRKKAKIADSGFATPFPRTAEPPRKPFRMCS